jgi:hypothetical protein
MFLLIWMVLFFNEIILVDFIDRLPSYHLKHLFYTFLLIQPPQQLPALLISSIFYQVLRRLIPKFPRHQHRLHNQRHQRKPEHHPPRIPTSVIIFRISTLIQHPPHHKGKEVAKHTTKSHKKLKQYPNRACIGQW